MFQDRVQDAQIQFSYLSDSGGMMGRGLMDGRGTPPLVRRLGERTTLKRVFCQEHEVIMQSAQGWFRFESGVMTKSQSSKTTYH